MPHLDGRGVRVARGVAARWLHQRPPGASVRSAEYASRPCLGLALAKAPGERFQTARDFSEALEACGIAAADAPVARTATRLIRRGEATAAPGARAESTGHVWDAALLEPIVRDLSKAIGPVAKVLVQRVAGSATTIEQLYERLAAQIPNESARAEFIRSSKLTRADLSRIQSASATTEMVKPIRFDDDVLDQVARDLMPYTGPVARVLVRKAAREAPSIQALYLALSQHVASPDDRVAFLDKCPR